MISRIILFIFLIPLVSIAQKEELSKFDNLIGKTWRAEGNWGDGSKFIQEISFKYSLDSTLVISNTKGLINPNQKELSPRSHGIRQYDKNSKTINFWEFDNQGGLTKGAVYFNGKDIYYQYKYKESILTDLFEYVNDSTYNYKVGNYKNTIWVQTYLSTQFKLVE